MSAGPDVDGEVCRAVLGDRLVIAVERLERELRAAAPSWTPAEQYSAAQTLRELRALAGLPVGRMLACSGHLAPRGVAKKG